MGLLSSLEDFRLVDDGDGLRLGDRGLLRLGEGDLLPLCLWCPLPLLPRLFQSLSLVLALLLRLLDLESLLLVLALLGGDICSEKKIKKCTVYE